MVNPLYLVMKIHSFYPAPCLSSVSIQLHEWLSLHLS